MKTALFKVLCCALPVFLLVACDTPEKDTVAISGLPACVTQVQITVQQGTTSETTSAATSSGGASVVLSESFDFTQAATVVVTPLAVTEPCEFAIGVPLAFEGTLTGAGARRFSVAFGSFALVTAPGGGAFPGAPGGPDIPTPRPETRPQTDVLGPLAAQAKTAAQDNPDDTEGTFPTPQGVDVKWERQSDGSLLVTIPASGGPNAVILRVSESAEGVCHITYEQVQLPRTFYGYYAVFYADPGGCQDLIWVQYLERRTRFFDAAGNPVGPPHNTGPEVDKQIPYEVQGHPGGAGSAWMEDPPGINTNPALGAQQAAPAALNEIKTLEGVGAANITKAEVVWTFTSYLICLTPYAVKGHYTWGFTLTIDVNTAPYISTSNIRTPQWTPSR